MTTTVQFKPEVYAGHGVTASIGYSEGRMDNGPGQLGGGYARGGGGRDGFHTQNEPPNMEDDPGDSTGNHAQATMRRQQHGSCAAHLSTR